MAIELYAMHETALEKFLLDLDAARVLFAENPKGFSLFGNDPDKDGDDEDLYDLDDDGMATIPITGPLMAQVPAYLKYFGVNATGYGDVLKALAKAKDDPAVKCVTLAMNTPGGEVHGCDNVWSAVRGMGKPVAARNDGMIASAGYYIASAAGHIFATAPTNETGSIGVVMAGYDTSKADEKYGVRRVAIYSKNAPNKAMSFDTEKGRALIQDRADAFERIFHARVAEGRGIAAADVPEKFGQGGLFIAQDPDKTKPNALNMGLIDAVAKSWNPSATASGFQASATFPVSQPAQAGKPLPEEPMKTLAEFLASGPEAKAELDAYVAAKVTEATKSAEARASRVGTILASDAYKDGPLAAVIQAKGVECLKGNLTPEAFEQVVTMADMIKAQAAVSGAKFGPDGKLLPETNGQEHQMEKTVTVESAAKLTAEQIDKLTQADFAAFSPEVVQAIAARTIAIQGGN